MPTVAPGVTLVASTKTSNTFLIEGDDGLTLVDAGAAKGAQAVLAAIGALGREPSDLRRIVLTHAHPDHVQAAPELRERTGAKVLIHQADADWLPAGRVPAHGRTGAAGRFFDRLPIAHWKPFEPDQTVVDGEEIKGSGLRVIHTPGHSPGHIALLHEPSRTLLVGDAVFHTKDLSLGPAFFAADAPDRSASLNRLPGDVAAVGFGHGAPLAGAQVDGFVALLRGAPAAR